MSSSIYRIDISLFKKSLLTSCVFAALISVGLLYIWPKSFVAETLLLPPQQQQATSASTLAQLGALAGAAGFGPMVPPKTPDEMYVAFFKTRRIQAEMVRKFSLREVYSVDSDDQALLLLAKKTSVTVDKKSGLIRLQVEDGEPRRAAELANGYLPEIRMLLSKIAVTEAQQKRKFFEEQVALAKDALVKSEADLARTQHSVGIGSTPARMELSVKVATELRAELLKREIQLSTIGRFQTDKSHEYEVLSSQIKSLKQRLTAIEDGQSNTLSDNRSPSGLAIRALRNLKVQEALLEALMRQLELAKIDEAKDGPMFQQIDPAVPPIKHDKPNKIWLGGGAFMFVFVVMFCYMERRYFASRLSVKK